MRRSPIRRTRIAVLAIGLERSQQTAIATGRQAAMKRWFYMDSLWLQYVEGRQWYPELAAG